MKNFIDNFKKNIRGIVVVSTSREFAFIYCLLGVFAQIAHTYYLTSHISSFNGGFKVFQATLLSAFISSSLLYFVSITDDSESKENKNNKLAVNVLMIIEILINLYYYSRHLLIDSKEIQIFDFIFAILISSMIPVLLKMYASKIKAKEWITEWTKEYSDTEIKPINDGLIETDEQYLNYLNVQEKINIFIEEKLSEIKSVDTNLIDEKIIEFKKEFLKTIDSDISIIFEKNQKLFLSQFENKVKMIVNKESISLMNEKESSQEIKNS